MCVFVSLNKPTNNLADSPRPWAGCYHGNLTASIFLAHTFPLNSRPMTDQPTGKSGLLKAHAQVVCLSIHCVYVGLCMCIMWAWYRSRELYNLSAPHTSQPNVALIVGHSVSYAWHIWFRSIFISREDAAMWQGTGHICQIEEWSEKSRGKETERTRRHWYSGKLHCANSSLAGKVVEKTALRNISPLSRQ